MNQKDHFIAVIGAGKMATAMSLGLVSVGMPADRICAYDVNPEAAGKYAKETGCRTAASPEEALAAADTVLLAVKPFYAPEVLRNAASFLQNKLLISIVAGLRIAAITEMTPESRIVRVMPNTPALVRQGMTCYTVAENVTEEERDFAQFILSGFGVARQVQESLLDAVTGLSGSGPAYVIEFLLGLAEGGVYCGLPRELALTAAIQTVLGTAEMCRQNPELIYGLRDAVITPNGTTARGIHVLDQAGFRGIVENCVIAAAARSAELGR